MSDIFPPKVSQVNFDLHENLELINLSYDLWRLTITLTMPGKKKMIYLTFENIYGFRLLDEGDLLEFWDSNTGTKGFLWKVESGGWLDLEKNRGGFVSGHNRDIQEYLVKGINECASVLTSKGPAIDIID
ncbi:MAG: hypothetical protein VXW38_11960 [Bacteroidota bacterium]|nr:hypothetical protein [Bacteroidota bacterium]